MIRDYQPGTITPEEEREGDSFKVNHRGDDKWLIPLAGFVNKFCRWGASKKRFRVIIDYDPEWSMKVTFRRMTQAEAELMKAHRPTKDELDKIQERIASHRSDEAYTFSSHRNQDGIKMDITISTEKHMAMSELLTRYAALSHGVYLELAKDISAHK